MKNFIKFLRENAWDILIFVLMVANLLGVIFTDGHTQLLSAVTLWGLLISWRQDKAIGQDTVHVYLSGTGTKEELQDALEQAIKDIRLADRR